MKSKCDLAILSNKILPDEKNEKKMSVEDQQKRYEELAEKFVLLDIPMIVDRSADEEKNDAKVEWSKVYEAIFSQTDSADSFLDTEVENEKENDASGVHSFEYSAAWNGSTDPDVGRRKRIQQIQKKQKAAVRKKVPKKKKVRRLTDSPMIHDGSEYAEGFHVYYYKDGYKMIDIKGDAKFLVVPENQDVPDGAEEDYVILQQPLDHIYLAATSAMALFNAIDSLDNITMTGTQASGWYIENAVKAMDDGKIKFAGKYSEPDYEMLVDEDCDLAIESTMILHTPKVQEMIESLDIPVMIDRSSYDRIL